MRRKKKVPWSDRCHKRALKRLQEIKDAGYDPNRSLDDSSFYGWLDLYVPKNRDISPQATTDETLHVMERDRIASQSEAAIAAREACKRALKVVR